jgi:hypothetical protein
MGKIRNTIIPRFTIVICWMETVRKVKNLKLKIKL